MHILDLICKYNALGTFLGPFFDLSDLAVLRATCKTLRATISWKAGKTWIAEVVCRRGNYYQLLHYWRLNPKKDYLFFKCSGRDFEAQKMISKNCDPWELCRSAAKNGNLEFLKWARENGAPWGLLTCALAAQNGHLAVIQWARKNGAFWDENTCTYAAENGHLEVLKWARENGCPWNEWTCAYAAENGHLEVLKWARANGCPWNKNVCVLADKKGRLEVLKWAQENGAP